MNKNLYKNLKRKNTVCYYLYLEKIGVKVIIIIFYNLSVKTVY